MKKRPACDAPPSQVKLGKPDAKPLPLRTLCFIPGSHLDGTHELIRPEKEAFCSVAAACAGSGASKYLQAKEPTADNSLAFQLRKRPNLSSEAKAALAGRAVFLDIPTACRERPSASAFVVWDARLVHQGYTHFPDGCLGGPPATRKPCPFHPARVAPLLFSVGDVEGWSGHLATHGYAVICDLLAHATVAEACTLLLGDIQGMQADPSRAPQSLDTVTEKHLPNHENSGLRHRGLPHGEFAWFLRAQPSLLAVWRALYRHHWPPQTDNATENERGGSSGGGDSSGSGGSLVLAGAPAVVALTPPPSCVKPAAQGGDPIKPRSDSFLQFQMGEWLHLDYSPPPTPERRGPAGALGSGGVAKGANAVPPPMYQSTLLLFPADGEDGAGWGRIGLMTSMYPLRPAPMLGEGRGGDGGGGRAGEAREVQAMLLAGCILGQAAKSPAGLAWGHLQKLMEGYGVAGQTVLKPRMAPATDHGPAGVGAGARAGASGPSDALVAQLTNGVYPTRQKLQAAGKNKAQALVACLGLAGLKQLAHPRCVQYVCGI